MTGNNYKKNGSGGSGEEQPLVPVVSSEQRNQFEAVFDRIKTALRAKSETQAANLLGIAQPSITKARNRERVPPGWIETLARERGISADWLLFGEGSMKRGGTWTLMGAWTWTNLIIFP